MWLGFGAGSGWRREERRREREREREREMLMMVGTRIASKRLCYCSVGRYVISVTASVGLSLQVG